MDLIVFFLLTENKKKLQLGNQATHKTLTLKATTFLVTFVRTIKHFFSPVSLDPKYSSSAGLIENLKRISFFKLSLQ